METTSFIEDHSSPFSIEDDGSLLILNRVSQDESLSPSEKVGSSPGDDVDDTEYEDSYLWEIEQILRKEQENLEMVRKANDEMQSMISTSNDALKSKIADITNDIVVKDVKCDDVKLPNENSVAVAVKPYQKLFRRLSNNFRHRRQPTRLNRGGNSPLNVQTFVQDYYKSLNSVSRYIIVASIMSFVTAFLLLSCYSAQTHSHDMEMFKLKENRVLADQKVFEDYKLQNQNFRESLIHQRYEESRECQSSLQSCHSKRDELSAQISKLDLDAGKNQTKLEAKVDSQVKEIRALQAQLEDLQKQSKYQLQNENFREDIIHQRYEESKECQSSLQSCNSKRDGLVAQIAKMDRDAGKMQTKLEANVESQRKEIQSLKAKLQDLQQQNRELRKEIGQYVSSSFAQILLNLLNILKNKSVQIAFGTVLTIGLLVGIICSAFSK